MFARHPASQTCNFFRHTRTPCTPRYVSLYVADSPMVPPRAAMLVFGLVLFWGIGLTSTCAPNAGPNNSCQTLWKILQCLSSNKTSFSKSMQLARSTGLSWSLDDDTTALTFFAVPDDQWPAGLDDAFAINSNLAAQTALYMTFPGGYSLPDLLNASTQGIASALTETYAMQDESLLSQFPLEFSWVTEDYDIDNFVMVRGANCHTMATTNCTIRSMGAPCNGAACSRFQQRLWTRTRRAMATCTSPTACGSRRCQTCCPPTALHPSAHQYPTSLC